MTKKKNTKMKTENIQIKNSFRILILLLTINKTYVVYQLYYNNTGASKIPNLFDSHVL